MTRTQAILLGLAVFAIGGGGYWVFRSSGLEGFSPGIAASALLMLVVLVLWSAAMLPHALRLAARNMRMRALGMCAGL